MYQEIDNHWNANINWNIGAIVTISGTIDIGWYFL